MEGLLASDNFNRAKVVERRRGSWIDLAWKKTTERSLGKLMRQMADVPVRRLQFAKHNAACDCAWGDHAVGLRKTVFQFRPLGSGGAACKIHFVAPICLGFVQGGIGTAEGVFD